MQPLIDSVVSRPRWKAKLTTITAGLILVRAVLTAIQIYMLTVFHLGSWGIKHIDSIQMNTFFPSATLANNKRISEILFPIGLIFCIPMWQWGHTATFSIYHIPMHLKRIRFEDI
jgi:hypothetical protein